MSLIFTYLRGTLKYVKQGDGMENQNITLSVPKQILRKAKIIAVRRNISLSKLMVKMMEEMVSEEEEYNLARARYLETRKRNIDLGTNGKITWTRDDLHER